MLVESEEEIQCYCKTDETDIGQRSVNQALAKRFYQEIGGFPSSCKTIWVSLGKKKPNREKEVYISGNMVFFRCL